VTGITVLLSKRCIVGCFSNKQPLFPEQRGPADAKTPIVFSVDSVLPDVLSLRASLWLYRRDQAAGSSRDPGRYANSPQRNWFELSPGGRYSARWSGPSIGCDWYVLRQSTSVLGTMGRIPPGI